MTMLGRKLIKNPGTRVPGRISHSPLDSSPASLALSFLICKIMDNEDNSSLEPKPIERDGKHYPKAWMIDQI